MWGPDTCSCLLMWIVVGWEPGSAEGSTASSGSSSENEEEDTADQTDDINEEMDGERRTAAHRLRVILLQMMSLETLCFVDPIYLD